MKTGIYFAGNELEKPIEAVAKGIVDVFEAAANTNMDQETVKVALNILSTAGTNKYNLSQCTIGDGVYEDN